MIKTRFAPSPTGFLHIGGLRTALYAYCFAKKHQGKFILRIEDTDRSRYVEGAIENLLNTLYWAGLVPDEGVVLDGIGNISQKGNCGGSYIQSERLDIYRDHALKLVDEDKAYYCFCSSERLDEVRKKQQESGQPIGYDRACRKIDPLEAKKMASEGHKHVIRMKMPEEGDTSFTDLIRGEVSIQNRLVDDQVIIKSDGFPTYHLAVVVDDHFMGISHVIRGEEWLSSTPKHLLLYKYFGWEPPQMAHLPLILNPDKSKLSKRQGDVAVEDYIQKGYLKDALINFVAFLGWNPGSEKELFTLSELINDFNLDKVGKSGAVFNLDKLDWYNKEYIKKLSIEELAILAKPFFEINGYKFQYTDEQLSKALSLERERVDTLAELPSAVSFIFSLPEYDKSMLIWNKSSTEELNDILPKILSLTESIDEKDWVKDKLEQIVSQWIKQNNFSNGSVLWPLRVALSGQDKSPGPFEIAEVLGKSESIRRINLAVKM